MGQHKKDLRPALDQPIESLREKPAPIANQPKVASKKYSDVTTNDKYRSMSKNVVYE